MGQRKLWGIVNLNKRYPNQCIDAACAQAMAQGVYSYKLIKALTEQLMAQALSDLAANTTTATPLTKALTQQHALIRDADEYGDLFAQASNTSAITNPFEGPHV